MVSSTKFGEEDKNNTFLGVSDNTLCLIDDRIAKTGLAGAREYKTNPKFVSVATTEEGNYVVACGDGNMRFYNQGVDAKKHSLNNIPTFDGDVLSVETSSDGLFVAGTYPSLILLVPTFSLEDVNLYMQSVPKSYRPMPTVLQVTPEDLGGMGVDITTASYTPAVFNINKSTKSRYIITSIEDFIVTWNLDAILSGQTEDTYNIIQMGSNMRTVQFRHNDAASFLSAGPGTMKNVQN